MAVLRYCNIFVVYDWPFSMQMLKFKPLGRYEGLKDMSIKTQRIVKHGKVRIVSARTATTNIQHF